MRQRKRSARKAKSKSARKTTRILARKPGRKAVKRPVVKRPAGKPVRKGSAKVGRAAKPKAAKPKAQIGARKPRQGAKPRVLPASPRVQKLRAMLEVKGAEILEKIRRARAESLEADRTSFAEVGDLVSASVEKEKAFESGEAGVNAMREIAGALDKLKGGTYGICERCGKPIGLKRLEAMPSATLCIKCKVKEEAVGKIVAPPADTIFED